MRRSIFKQNMNLLSITVPSPWNETEEIDVMEELELNQFADMTISEK